MCSRGTIRITFIDMNIALGTDVKVSCDAHTWQPPRPGTGELQPGDVIPIVESLSGLPYHVTLMQWGMQPQWADHPITNARDDKMRSTWSDEFISGRRCIVPFTGFFEHCKARGEDYVFSLDEQVSQPMLLAALHNLTWPHRQFSIITTQANSKVAPVHDRMPVILTWEQAQEWMHDGMKPNYGKLQSLLRPYQGELVRQKVAA